MEFINDEAMQPKSPEAKAAYAVINEIKKAVKGKDEVIKIALCAILSRGHILLEDMPGVGKTTLALAFSKSMQLHYNRVQFTSDVMPSDIIGYNTFNKNTNEFSYVRGAILCNLFLADEINRTSSKTQSALLQVMEEGRVTVDQKTYTVPEPFTVIATQNPVGYAGTQLLPESQLDRFMVRLSMGYPNKVSEVSILKSKNSDNTGVTPLLSANDIMAIQKKVDNCFINDEVYSYIVELSSATREHPLVELGISPRGSIALMRIAKANAILNDRDYVIPQDVLDMVPHVFSHRLVLKARARAKLSAASEIVAELCSTVHIPKF